MTVKCERVSLSQMRTRSVRDSSELSLRCLSGDYVSKMDAARSIKGHRAKSFNNPAAISYSEVRMRRTTRPPQGKGQVPLRSISHLTGGCYAKGRLQAAEFMPTRFSIAGDKAAFGNVLLHFLESNCTQELFTKSFYNRLSMCFGHLAHGDRQGFYDIWFTSDKNCLNFLNHTLRAHCWGQPEFTFCDVERAVQRELGWSNLPARFELRAKQTARSAEMETLMRLEAKYRVPIAADRRPDEISSTPITCDAEPISVPMLPVQASLFLTF